jgi:hypothetical protein
MNIWFISISCFFLFVFFKIAAPTKHILMTNANSRPDYSLIELNNSIISYFISVNNKLKKLKLNRTRRKK